MHTKILMCRPDYYGINYVINPWMDIQKKIEHSLAIQQWENLYHKLIECGANVELINPVQGCPDMVFTANAGLFYRDKIILSHFKFKERQEEESHFYDWFTKVGYEILNPDFAKEPYFEGAGDALFAGNKLFAGYGFRTQKEFFKQASYLDHANIIYCELTNPYFYHLDTCFCPINEKLAIWYPEAFSEESQLLMQQEIELIPVNQDEAHRFACNAVVVDNHVVLPDQCPNISAALEERGMTVHPCEINEYLKAGGACKCLTLRLV